MHFENLKYDFLLGDGTGGLSIWSLKNPEQPQFVGGVTSKQLEQPADAHGAADTPNGRFYEGENPTVDSRRKLAYLARDPRSFGNNSHPGGRTGLYIIDVKDPWNPKVVTYHWVPAGHTATCINDCRYLWSVGPANNGSKVAGQPQDVAGVLHPEWTGVPSFVTDVRDINHPYTYATPVDTKRNNNTTAYTHSVDVDQHGIAWTSGFGGVRGYYTNGLHTDAVRASSATPRRPTRSPTRAAASRRWRRRSSTRRPASSTTRTTTRRRTPTRRRRRSRRPPAARSTRPISSTSRRRTSPAAPRPRAAAPAGS